ncbi:hypothetical protein J7443_22180 [Tropicibacter sp. R15_0]|uniref:DUF6880 family protein n=1 Tax=Tropicibacter sp. R15_0 TaxID=2821101 RepID=UPI001ADC4652|nr:DUF6880 family protein [Tropicibacter sp. R15_0]MBO9467956.1 hypothetical protein [Tropicibacter sp. R15_0]
MSKKTLNAQNLTRLGADHLAELLMELSTGNADMQRRLRLELSHDLGPQELARDLRKRLASLRRAKSNISWRKRKAFLKELGGMQEMIKDRIAPDDPALGFDLMWDFIDLAPSVFMRTSDSSGEIGDLFQSSLPLLGPIGERALLEPEGLADRVWQAVSNDGFGLYQGLITILAPALGAPGLTALKARIDRYEAKPVQDPKMDHEALAFLRALRSETGNYRADQKARLIRQLRQEIAEAEGDVDALLASLSPGALRHPGTGADLAQKLLAAGRVEEAMARLSASRPDPEEEARDWNAAYIACLAAQGHGDEVQAFRWQCFEARLDSEQLRAHLAALPDFDDVEAEDSAMSHAQSYGNVTAALRFLLEWPALPALSQMITARVSELPAIPPDLSQQAAEKLRTRYPLAACLLLRGALMSGRLSTEQIQEVLADCATLDSEITDYEGQPDHAGFLADLKARLSR